jgi:hypothetical protein
VRQGEVPHEREPDAAALRDPHARGRVAPEAVEDAPEVLGRDADAGVDHLQHRLPLADAQAKAHRAARIRVAQGVGEQVVDDLRQPLGVALHPCGRGGAREDDAAVGEPVREGGPPFRGDLLDVDRALADEQARLLGLREQQHVVHQPVEAARVARGALERGLLVGHHTVLQRLDAADHADERVAQLVHDVGHGGTAQLVLAAQRGGQAVERPGQLRRLRGPPEPTARVSISPWAIRRATSVSRCSGRAMRSATMSASMRRARRRARRPPPAARRAGS